MSENNRFQPIELALTLPKGFAHEFRDRSWFNQIYFSKLSMAHESDGYMPILYQFSFDQPSATVPDQLLMTFYYPESKRVSNLNGIVIIGGQPDIYEAYQKTIEITPQLESLVIDKHQLDDEIIRQSLDHLLRQVSQPQRLRTIESILEQSLSKTEETLPGFFPILDDDQYQATKLALPTDFAIDGVFTLTITPEFLRAEQPGDGVETIQLFHHRDAPVKISPHLAYSLIIKWQPIYNDILKQLLQSGRVIRQDYHGHLRPRVVIFNNQKTNEYTALISSIGEYAGTLYYHIALATSGRQDGQPLSLLEKQLGREKFGQDSWVNRVVEQNTAFKDGYRDSMFAEDLISTDLVEVVTRTSLQSEGSFDLGRLQAINLEEDQ